MASSAAEPIGIRFAEGVGNSSTAKPRYPTQKTQTKRKRPNLPVQPTLKINAKKNINQIIAETIGNAIAKTNTITAARKKIEASNLLEPTKKAALEKFDEDYVKKLRTRPAGEVDRNLALNTAAGDIATNIMEHAENFEEAEAILETDPDLNATVKNRALQFLKREFSIANASPNSPNTPNAQLLPVLAPVKASEAPAAAPAAAADAVPTGKKPVVVRRPRTEAELAANEVRKQKAKQRANAAKQNAEKRRKGVLAAREAKASVESVAAAENEEYNDSANVEKTKEWHRTRLNDYITKANAFFTERNSLLRKLINAYKSGTNTNIKAELNASSSTYDQLEKLRRDIVEDSSVFNTQQPEDKPLFQEVVALHTRLQDQSMKIRRLQSLLSVLKENPSKKSELNSFIKFIEPSLETPAAPPANELEPPNSPPSPDEPESPEASDAADAPNINNSALMNAKQPTLMRIGGDSASEYVELKGGQFKSLGGFEIVTMSLGTREFKQHYGIKTQQQFSVMQRVFGVPRLGGKPRLWMYLDKNCKFNDINVVIAALKFRSKTLQVAISMNVDSNTSRRYKHLKDWIDATVQKLEKATDPCPPELANASTEMKTMNVGVGPNATSGATGPQGGPACPCLTDINLLRDLVYVMALARGNASPEVRKQIAAIPINSLLEAAAGNNTTKIYPNMKSTLIEIIKILRSAQTAVKNGEIPEVPQDVLKQIYKALAPPNAAIPDAVDLDDVLALINDMQNALTAYEKELEEAKRAQPSSNEEDPELLALRGIRPALEEKIAGLEQELSKADEIYKEIQETVDALEADLRKCNDEKAEHERVVQALQDEINRIYAEKSEEAAAENAKDKELLDAKEVELAAARDALERTNEILVGMAAELEAAKAAAAEVEDLKAKLAACEDEKDTKQRQLDAAEEEVTRLTGELASLTNSSTTQKNQSSRARATLEAQLKKWKETVAELTADQATQSSQIAALGQQVKGQLSELEQLRARVAELSGEKKRANNATARAVHAEVAGLEMRNTIKNLQGKLGTAEAAIGEREAAMIVAKAELAAAHDALAAQRTQQNTNRAAAAADFEQQLAQEKAKLADCVAAGEAARTQHEADLKKLNDQLAEARSALDKLQALADNTAGKQVATAQQLESATATIKQLEAEVASKTTTGEQQQSSFEAERSSFKERIADLESQVEAEHRNKAGIEQKLKGEIASLGERLRQLETDHAAEISRMQDEQSTKNRASAAKQEKNAANAAAAAKAELDSKAAEIAQLKQELATKQVELGIVAEKNAAIAAKNTLLASQKEEMGAKNAKISALEAEKSRLSAQVENLSSQLGAVQGSTSAQATQLANLQAKLQAATEQKRKNDEQLSALKASLNAAPKQANVDELSGKLSTAESELAKVSARLAEVEAAKGSIEQTSSTALNNLLAQLAVSEEQRAALEKAAKGNMSGITNIKKETCDFFFFLYDTINLQLRNIKALKLSESLKTDIFKMYNLPESYATMDKQDLLNELSGVFQEFFIKFDTRTGVGGKGLVIDNSYPLLTEIFKNTKVVEGKGICSLTPLEQVKIRDELNRIGYQYQYGIEPVADSENKLVILSKLDPDICVDKTHKHDHLVPLTVLALRMIQLLHETFEGRYEQLKLRCQPIEASGVDMPEIEESA